MGHLMQMNNASNMKGREKTNRLKMRICRKQFSPKFQCRKQENNFKIKIAMLLLEEKLKFAFMKKEQDVSYFYK